MTGGASVRHGGSSIRPARFFGEGLPSLRDFSFPGSLIVVEGPDGSGRTTFTDRLASDLESRGHAVTVTGLKRSVLVSPGIIAAKRTLLAERRTMTLYYAADFADQLENRIIPSLKAGFVVLCDRYIYTIMARAIVRGMDTAWLRGVFGIALVPDLVLYLRVSPETLLERALRKNGHLDYWESGVDLGLSMDTVESFLEYQRRIGGVFEQMGREYGFTPIEDGGSIEETYPAIQQSVLRLLERNGNGNGEGSGNGNGAGRKDATAAVPPAGARRKGGKR